MKLGVLLNDLPRETNRVDLDPDVKDAWGQPVARITHTNHPNDLVLGNWQVNKNKEILEAAGASKVLPVYFEQSTYYHRYTVDFYLHLALVLEARGEALADEVRGPLERALDYLVALVRPDGSSPLIGDDDGGRLMMLNSRPANDFRDTIGLGGVLLRGPEYCFAAGPLPVEAGWLLGPGAGERYRAAGSSEPPASVVFREGGHAVMRSAWRPGADWLLFDCGPQGAFGHSHADALAIELAVEGRPVLVDAGTFTYVAEPEWRERFRGGAKHNSVTLAGESSALSAGPFRWEAGADAKLTAWVSTPELDYAAGLHHGFWRFSPPATHRPACPPPRGPYSPRAAAR
jgi:hypothetical protein